MKTICLCIFILLLFGCASKIVIPDPPQFRELEIVYVPGGICMDNANLEIFAGNVKALKEQNEKLRKLIENHNGGAK